MQLLGRDHVAKFAVLVSLARLERLVVGHRDGSLKALFETGEIAQVCRSRDGNFSAQLLRISGDSSQDHHAPGRVCRCLQQRHHQMNQEEMTKVVGRHRNLVPLRRALGLLQTWFVHRSVTNQGIDLMIQGGNGTPHTIQITQIHLDVLQTLLRNVQCIGSARSPLRGAVRSDHTPTLSGQRLHSIKAYAGGGSSHQNRARGAGHLASPEWISLPGRPWWSTNVVTNLSARSPEDDSEQSTDPAHPSGGDLHPG